MSFFSHMDELRKRLVIVAAGIFVAAGIAWGFMGPILALLQDPLPKDVELFFGRPLEAFMAKLKISLFTGFVLASPITLYQILAFLNPAMTGKEKRFVYPSLVSGLILAAGGIIGGYLYIFPIGINWLVAQGTDIGLNPILLISEYVTFSAFFLLGLGLAAETPLILLAAIKLGLVSVAQLKKNWRIVYIVILLSAAIITPDWSPVTMVAVAGPMLVLYHFTLIFARFVKPRGATT